MNRFKREMDTTGIVLAGGMSSRFGVNKALIPWKGSRLIESVLDRLTALFPATLVLVKNPEEFHFLDRPGVQVRKDLIRENHPLGGILSGLMYAETDYVFVCACDMPYIQSELIKALCRVRDGFDVAVPVWNGRPQPLCGIYSKRCVESIESMIDRENYKVFELYDDVRTRYIDEEEVKVIDPQGLSFVDVDTADDYLAAQRIGGPEEEADA